MDKKKGVKNITISIFFKFVMLFESILLRRFFIQYLGNELNGLSSLYGSIIGFLSITELGIGSAIIFSMYKPIVAGDQEKVAALYRLYKKLYFIIGLIIFTVGLALLPFLKFIAKDYQSIDVNLQLTFFLVLLSTVITYLFAAKTSLINAYKYNYINTTVSSLCTILQHALQIVIMILTKSFVWYLICAILFTLIQWLIIEIYVRKSPMGVILKHVGAKIGEETKKEVVRNTKAQFMHKIGGVLVNTVDSVVISAFIGVAVLGKYSNYNMVMSYLIAVISMFFSSLSSVVGIACAEVTEGKTYRYFRFFHTFNFALALIFLLGYFAIVDDLVTILLGNNLELARQISFIITLNNFIQYMRNATLLFRDATGCFYYDRWKPIFEGITNLALSILFVLILPEDYGVVGVILATIITNLFICHVVEPYVLFKHALKRSAKAYYIKNYSLIAIFTVALTALGFCHVSIGNAWASLFVNGFISLGFSVPICAAVFLIDKDFRKEVKNLLSQGLAALKSKRKKKEENKEEKPQ